MRTGGGGGVGVGGSVGVSVGKETGSCGAIERVGRWISIGTT